MLPAKCNASDPSEKAFAQEVAQGQRLHVVLHLEQPAKHSKLSPRAIDPANVQLKLKAIIKPIDPHPKVVESTQMGKLAWQVK
jgi:hypothetical protein